MRIFVANLPRSVTSEQLASRFAQFGDVSNCRVVRDEATGESRGFAFADMCDREALLAIQMLNREKWDGRTIRCEQAKERVAR